MLADYKLASLVVGDDPGHHFRVRPDGPIGVGTWSPVILMEVVPVRAGGRAQFYVAYTLGCTVGHPQPYRGERPRAASRVRVLSHQDE
jgi:hypothetical protein